MNADQHVHDLQFKEWPYCTSTMRRGVDIVYGDQQEKWPVVGPFKDARRRRKVLRIVASHDKGSIEAGQKVASLQDQANKYGALAQSIAGSGWQR